MLKVALILLLMQQSPPGDYKVVRADRSSEVRARIGNDYGFLQGFTKVFFDPATRREIKRIDYGPDTSLSDISTPDAQRFLNVDLGTMLALKAKTAPFNYQDDQSLPAELHTPQSTYAEFALARPRRVRGGYTKEVAHIEEHIGAYAIADGRIWFGKAFYDGEGTTGVGGIGFFERASRKYTLLRIPEVVDWSVSALLVDGQTIWAGLVNHPEGADNPGGLIRYDSTTGQTQKFSVEEVILKFVQRPIGLYLITPNSVYLVKDDSLTRYGVEPDINGKLIIVTSTLDSAQRTRPSR